MCRRNSRTARSPLRLRVTLAAGGAILLITSAAYAFTRESPAPGLVTLGAVAALLAVVAVIDLIVVVVRITHTPHTDRKKQA